MRTIYLIISACFLIVLSSLTLKAQTDSSILSKQYPELELYYSWIEKEKIDSTYHTKLNYLENLNPDTLFYHYSTKKYEEIFEEVFFFHERRLRNKEYQEVLKEVEKIEKAAKQYNSHPLMLEAEYIKSTYLPVNNDADLQEKEELMWDVIRKAEKNKNDYIKIRALTDLWANHFYSKKYAKSFYYIDLLVDETEKNDRVELMKNCTYFRAAQTYYNFRDYDRSFYYLKKALEHPSNTFCENFQIMTYNYLANYYAKKNQPDSTIYYYHSILKKQPLYRGFEQNAVAISNLGHLALEYKDYDKAIAFLYAGREAMLADNDFGFVARIDIGLGNAYLAKGDLKSTWERIESARNLGVMHSFDTRTQKLYSLISKYYTYIGNPELASLYQDSAVIAVQEYEKEYTSLYIAQGEQLVHERETNVKNEEIKFQKKRAFYTLGVALLVTIALIITAIYYRKTRKAYRTLVKKSREWALSPSGHVKDIALEPVEGHNIEEDERGIMKQVFNFVVVEEGFKDPDLTLLSLAGKLNINRSYLSRAINSVTGKSFTVWLNEYRIKEAIKLLSNNSQPKLSMDGLAFEIGFNNRTTFYRAFKKITGISPSNFKDNQEDTHS